MFNIKCQKRTWLINIIWLMYCFLLIIPVFFLYQKNSDWVRSKHLNLPWNKKEPIEEIMKDKMAGQSFIAKENNLSRIDIMFRKGSGKYIFHLKNTPQDKKDLVSGIFKNKAQNYDLMAFEFQPIKDSKNKPFYFYIEATEGNKESIGVFRTSEQANKRTSEQAWINGEPRDFSFVFQVYYRNEISKNEFFKILMERLEQNKPAWIKMPYGLVFFILFLGAIFWFLRTFLKKVIFESINKPEELKSKVLLLGLGWIMIIGIFLLIQGQAPIVYN